MVTITNKKKIALDKAELSRETRDLHIRYVQVMSIMRPRS
jgi:hypothetical protein